MKKKVLVLSSLVVFILIVGIVTLFYSDDDKVILESGKNNTIVRSNAITMMYETGYKTGEYQVTSDNVWPESGYTYNESLSTCENGSKIYWNSETNKVMMEATTADKCYVYFDADPVTLASYIVNNVYTGTDGDNELYYHDGTGSYTNANQEAGDNSYRYSGANPNNYVCFGSDESICPANYLYRIIGVFNGEVKLIKATSYGNYAWESDWDEQGNTWNETTKPDIRTTLNSTYLGTLSSVWEDKISDHTWKVGGGSNTYLSNSSTKIAYNYEVGLNSSSATDTMKIGLMYVSDYGYATSPENWTTTLYEYSLGAYRNDWMYLGSNEWTITRSTNSTSNAFNVSSLGWADYGYGLLYNSYSVRPTFYLQPWVLYSSGDGTQENPYRISAPENLIEFTIDDTIYYAEEGMTWGEWVASYYNGDDFKINGTTVKNGDLIISRGTCISTSDTILSDTSYSLSSSCRSHTG